MKIEKLPSGSYRMRKMYKGKTYSIVTDYKPTQKEALQLMAEELDKIRDTKGRITFQHAGREYIESKRNVLSPRTIREYKGIIKHFSENFLEMNIRDIEPMDIQKEINRIAIDRGPKTVRNYHGFISAVLGVYRPNLKINTTLPQRIKSEPYIPSDDDVKIILEYAKDTRYEIPIILACYGMRRSEICALTAEDINGDIVTINKALVMDDAGNWVLKNTKTTASTREIIIPMAVAKKIKERGYVYNGHPNSITDFLTSTQKELGLPHFSLHKLRHYFASKMSAMHVPDENILKLGGWETDAVMKKVYRHAMRDQEKKAQREASKKLENVLF